MNAPQMTPRERFIATMEYAPVDRLPNHEVGVWGQTIDRWQQEGLEVHNLHWDWFVGEEYFGMDPREYIPVNFGMLPGFDEEIIEETERYVIKRHANGVVTRALLEGSAHGTRASMDEYLEFPIKDRSDFLAIKKRYISAHQGRYPPQWESTMLPGWLNRKHVLILGRNCGTLGFYWRAREWMGTEGVSYAWYDQPSLMHEMMEFVADFTIEVSRPVLEKVAVDYIFLNEDMAMRSGPLLSPATYRKFIFPHMRRLVDFYKGMGVLYFIVDTDGDSDPLLPSLLEAGVDAIWPVERAADHMDPLLLRKKYGRQLRLWGGVDKRELTRDEGTIDRHLQSLVPLVEDGGFIPTVDHLVPPDVPLNNFLYYMKRKEDLLSGRF